MAPQSSTTGAPPPVPAEYRTIADAVVHQAPPPVATSSRRRKRKKRPVAATGLQLDVQEQQKHSSAESKSWLSSIGIHLIAFIVIMLVLVPADFGGSEKQEIMLRFGDGESQGTNQGVDVDIEAVEEPVEIVEQGEAMVVAKSTGGDGGGSKSEGEKGPRGSFFGIEANGHEFVYILDMSGSMRGKRYETACEELIRSVDGLAESQKFYVLLFSSGAEQMFYSRSKNPTPVLANGRNKASLATWLDEAYRGGSTDPRDALRIALRMNPSAIFMLSDGEFRDPKHTKSSMFAGMSDAFEIVAGSTTHPPIHAIAFEDRSSCENMKRLSFLTDGQYRFVGANSQSELAEKWLAEAEDEMRDGDFVKGRFLLADIVRQHGYTEAAWQARVKLCRMLDQEAVEYLREGKPAAARRAFLSMVRIDPQGTVTSDMQSSLLQKLLNQADLSTDPNDSKDLLDVFTLLANDFGLDKMPRSVIEPYAKAEVLRTIKIAAKNPLEGVRRFSAIRKAFPASTVAEECEFRERKLANELLKNAADFRRANGDAEYAKQMMTLRNSTGIHEVRQRATSLVSAVALELRNASRNAAMRGDSAAKKKYDKALTDAFKGSTVANKLIAEKRKREVAASRALREAMAMERSGGTNSAVREYNKVASTYPETLAAKKAKEHVDRLKPAPQRPAVAPRRSRDSRSGTVSSPQSPGKFHEAATDDHSRIDRSGKWLSPQSTKSTSQCPRRPTGRKPTGRNHSLSTQTATHRLSPTG